MESYQKNTESHGVRTLVFDFYAQHNAHQNNVAGVPLDDELFAEITAQTNKVLRANLLRSLDPSTSTSPAEIKRLIHNVSRTKSDIKKWLENPAQFTPYIDDVAIMYAYSFYPRVIDNLSTGERHMLAGMLWISADPWDEIAGQANERRMGDNAVGTPRRLRFEALSEPQKASLRALRAVSGASGYARWFGAK